MVNLTSVSLDSGKLQMGKKVIESNFRNILFIFNCKLNWVRRSRAPKALQDVQLTSTAAKQVLNTPFLISNVLKYCLTFYDLFSRAP